MCLSLFLRREEEDLKRSMEAIRRKLQTMEGSRSDRLRRFGEKMPALLAAIEDADRKGQFRKKPVGPLGKTYVCVCVCISMQAKTLILRFIILLDVMLICVTLSLVKIKLFPMSSLSRCAPCRVLYPSEGP